MTDETIVANPFVGSRLLRIGRALTALRARLARFGRTLRREAGYPREVVGVGSIVRVFDRDALRETTLVLAPSGRGGTSRGMIAADSAVGVALLGRRVGETRRWDDPSEPGRFQVVRIIGRLAEAAFEPAAARRRAVRQAPKANAGPRRKTSIRRPLATPIPAAA